jgi:hypothetical protein
MICSNVLAAGIFAVLQVGLAGLTHQVFFSLPPDKRARRCNFVNTFANPFRRPDRSGIPFGGSTLSNAQFLEKTECLRTVPRIIFSG